MQRALSRQPLFLRSQGAWRRRRPRPTVRQASDSGLPNRLTRLPARPSVLHWKFVPVHWQAAGGVSTASQPVAGRTAARDLCNLRAANRVRAGRQQR